MTAPIVAFYFEVVSPNSDIAAHGIGDIAAKHARAVDWRPVSLCHIRDSIGPALGKPGAKARYLVRDFKRSAEVAGNTAALGVGADEMMAAAAALTATEEAIEAGAFGVPTIVVDGGPFGGLDRLAHLDWRLARRAAE